jgi:hypothetical protein
MEIIMENRRQGLRRKFSFMQEGNGIDCTFDQFDQKLAPHFCRESFASSATAATPGR